MSGKVKISPPTKHYVYNTKGIEPLTVRSVARRGAGRVRLRTATSAPASARGGQRPGVKNKFAKKIKIVRRARPAGRAARAGGTGTRDLAGAAGTRS